MLPKALQLPGNWHFKPSVAKTCSHNMFMKCQMLQNAVVTALCTRYTSFLTLSQYCFFHTFTFSYHMFFLTISVSFPSPNPYNPLGKLSISGFSKAAFIQPPPPYKPVRLHPFLPLLILNLVAQWILTFQIWLCCYFPSYQLHHQSWSSCLFPSQPRCTKPYLPVSPARGLLRALNTEFPVFTLEYKHRTKAITQIQQPQSPIPHGECFWRN